MTESNPSPAGPVASRPGSPLARLRAAWTGAALIVFNTALLLLVLEAGAHAFLLLRHAGSGPAAAADADPKALAHAYPGRTPEQIRQAREAAVLTQVYAPWVQFRGPDRATPQVNVAGFERRSVPDLTRTAAAGEAFEVWFFGGSTMQGTRVGDDETIPSHFARLAGERHAGSVAVRVRNFGQPYYYSLQESALLYQLLMSGKRPGAAIFLDGLNDVLQPGSTYYRQPFWTPRLERLFEQGDRAEAPSRSLLALWRATAIRQLLDADGVSPPGVSERSSYTPPPGVAEDELVRTILDRYFETVRGTQRLCRAFGVDCYFFWQPVPHYRYPNRAADPFALQKSSTRFGSAYSRMEERSRAEGVPVFLGDMLEKESGYPFVDAVHYSSPFQARIAARMLQVVRLP